MYVGHQFQSLAISGNGQRSDGVVDDVSDAEGLGLQLEFAGLHFRKIQDVVEDGEQRLGRRTDGLQRLTLITCEGRIKHQFGHADDAVHRGANLVTHVGEKFALGATARLGGILGVVQRVFDQFPVGDIDQGAFDDGLSNCPVVDDRGADEHPRVGPIRTFETGFDTRHTALLGQDTKERGPILRREVGVVGGIGQQNVARRETENSCTRVVAVEEGAVEGPAVHAGLAAFKQRTIPFLCGLQRGGLRRKPAIGHGRQHRECEHHQRDHHDAGGAQR